MSGIASPPSPLALVLTTSLTQVLSYGNDAFFTQHGEF